MITKVDLINLTYKNMKKKNNKAQTLKTNVAKLALNKKTVKALSYSTDK